MVTSATIMPTAVVVLPALIVFELITAAVIAAAGRADFSMVYCSLAMHIVVVISFVE